MFSRYFAIRYHCENTIGTIENFSEKTYSCILSVVSLFSNSKFQGDKLSSLFGHLPS